MDWTSNLADSTAIYLCLACQSVGEPMPILPVPVAVRNHAVELAKYGYDLIEKHYPKAAIPLQRIALTVGAVRAVYKQWPGRASSMRCLNPKCGCVFR